MTRRGGRLRSSNEEARSEKLRKVNDRGKNVCFLQLLKSDTKIAYNVCVEV